MHNIISYIIVFIFGSVIGSFLNVCIYRIPRNISIIMPSSRCPSCDIPVRPSDNIPILSYILLGGRCRICKARISFRYPLVEFLNAIIYVLVLWRFGFGWHTPVYFVFCSSLIVISFIDLDFQIIPDVITLPGIPIGIMFGGFLGWKGVILTTFLGSLSGAIVGVLVILFKGKEKGSRIPFGPFLALGSVITLFYGQEIFYWYLGR